MSYLRDDASTFLPQATLDEGEKSEIIDKVTSKYAALGPMSKQQTKLEYLDLCNSDSMQTWCKFKCYVFI